MARIYHGFAPVRPTANKMADGPKEAKQPPETKTKGAKPKNTAESDGK